jgi:hypothetical protein
VYGTFASSVRVVSCDEPLGRTVVLVGNLGDGGSLKRGRLRDDAKTSVCTGDNGKGGSGGESRFVL